MGRRIVTHFGPAGEGERDSEEDRRNDREEMLNQVVVQVKIRGRASCRGAESGVRIRKEEPYRNRGARGFEEGLVLKDQGGLRPTEKGGPRHTGRIFVQAAGGVPRSRRDGGGLPRLRHARHSAGQRTGLGGLQRRSDQGVRVTGVPFERGAYG